MIIGILLIIIGFILMTGERNTDPNEWDTEKVYSFRQITLAPIVILAGLILEIYAILLPAKDKSAT